MHTTVFEGITFIEGAPARYQTIKPISIEVGAGAFQQSQLMTLDDVKRKMAKEAKASGGNAIVNFIYGQKTVVWWRALFTQLDDVNWYGAGTIALIERQLPKLPKR